jgi:hypothetical protein
VDESKPLKQVSATPITRDHVLEASADTVNILKSALDIVSSVPGAQPVLELALVLIETCQVRLSFSSSLPRRMLIQFLQDLTEIEKKVSELKEHIESITLSMVKAIEGKESASIPQDLLNDIETLGTCVFSLPVHIFLSIHSRGYI